MRFWPALFVLSISLAAFGQANITGNAQTSGPCSPAVSGHNDSFNIQCKVDSEQGKKVVEILNKILANQMDFARVNEKLDEILKNINPNLPAKTYFCNGIWKSVGPSADAAVSVDRGGSTAELKQEISLNDQRRFPELLAECQAEIESTPQWLTPRLTCALAYLAMNDKDNARKMLQEYESGKGPGYDVSPCTDIDQFLHQHLDSQ